MNHTFNPSRIMSDKEMFTGKDYAVHVTSNEGKKREHVMDCYRNALTKAMHCMNPNVHMIVIKEIDDKGFNGGLQRWDRNREVYGNDWEECDVDDLITLGKIVQFINVGTTDEYQDFDPIPDVSKKAKHHWWGLSIHMQRYADYLINDTSEHNWANAFLLKGLFKQVALVRVFAEICDYKEQNQQSTKFPFMKSGKNSKVTLQSITDYTDADFSEDPELDTLISKLRYAVEDTYPVDAGDYTKSHDFSVAWKDIRWQWQDMVAF